MRPSIRHRSGNGPIEYSEDKIHRKIECEQDREESRPSQRNGEMVGIAQIEARNALFPELVGAEANPRPLFARLTPESNTKVPSFLHPMRYPTSGPGPSSKSANAAVD